MKVLRDGVDLDQFFERLRRAPRRVLMLDYDGTLAPFRAARDTAVPYPGVREILDALIAGDACRVVIVSGRAIEALIPLLGLARLPELWGSHGWERRHADGTVERPPLPQPQQEGLREAAELGQVELKPYSVAFHHRGMEAGPAAEWMERVRRHCAPIAHRTGLELHTFDGGLELRAPGRSKADAVTEVLLEDGVVVAYLGDDATDEDAFAVLKSRGLGVLVRDQMRPTAADLRLSPPEELLEFLSRWRKICEGRA